MSRSRKPWKSSRVCESADAAAACAARASRADAIAVPACSWMLGRRPIGGLRAVGLFAPPLRGVVADAQPRDVAKVFVSFSRAQQR